MRTGLTVRIAALALLLFVTGAQPQSQGVADLMAVARSVGEAVVFEND